MFENFDKPIIFGHRGACALAPENTLASFNLAVDQGADFIELDAKLTADGRVVVIHDQTTNRTTGVSGTVTAMKLDELKALDAGTFFDTRFTGEKIPTLDEVFEEVGGKILINVELTNYSTPKDALVEEVAKLVKRHEMQRRVLFSSFLMGNLRKASALVPEAPVAILCLSGISGWLYREGIGFSGSPEVIHPNTADITEAYVKREHRRGRRVHVWTVNSEQDLARMFRCGVDGVFSDDPARARRVMEAV